MKLDMACLFQIKQSTNLQRPSKIILGLSSTQSNMVPDSAQTTPFKAPPSGVFRASVAQLFFATPQDYSMPGLPVYHQIPEFTQTHVHWVNDAIQPSYLLSPPSLSQHQGLFQWVSSSHQVAKVLEFIFSMSPYFEYSGLVSFRMDWLDLLAVKGTLKSLLQHHSWKKHQFFGAQVSS